MQVYEGNPDLYIQCDELPNNLTKFRWNTSYWKSEAIIIGSDDFS